MAIAAISVVRMLARKMKMMMRRQDAAVDQVVLDVVDGGLDEDRLIVNHLRVDIFRQQRAGCPPGAL